VELKSMGGRWAGRMPRGRKPEAGRKSDARDRMPDTWRPEVRGRRLGKWPFRL